MYSFQNMFVYMLTLLTDILQPSKVAPWFIWRLSFLRCHMFCFGEDYIWQHICSKHTLEICSAQKVRMDRETRFGFRPTCPFSWWAPRSFLVFCSFLDGPKKGTYAYTYAYSYEYTCTLHEPGRHQYVRKFSKCEQKCNFFKMGMS